MNVNINENIIVNGEINLFVHIYVTDCLFIQGDILSLYFNKFSVRLDVRIYIIKQFTIANIKKYQCSTFSK